MIAEMDIPNTRTIEYAALERATGVRRDDTRSDLFFLGCIYYHMLAGQSPLVELKDKYHRISRAVRRHRADPAGAAEPAPAGAARGQSGDAARPRSPLPDARQDSQRPGVARARGMTGKPVEPGEEAAPAQVTTCRSSR